MKILEVCPYSSSSCGVWARVRQESKELIKKGHQVIVFSSNLEKGTDKELQVQETIEGVSVIRFPAKKLGGESFMRWNYISQAVEYSPDVIIAHNYRHLHTTKALKVVKKLRQQGKQVKVLLVTHAPFIEGNVTRTKLQTKIVQFYDRFIGPRTLNKFDKILMISKWEEPYLLACGAKEDKLVYVPNGVPDEFFNKECEVEEENTILVFGRLSVKKKIESLLFAIPLLKDKSIKVELVGSREEPYANEIKALIKKLKLEDRVFICEPIYDLNDKIDKIDSCKLFVLPSIREGMSQGLIEAMARNKTVIARGIPANRDLVTNTVNGLLFDFDYTLPKIIDKALEDKPLTPRDSVRQFAWSKVIGKIEEIIK